MTIVIVANTIAGNQQGLILDGTGSGKNLPRILTGFGPVGYTDDGIVLQTGGITTPDRKTHIIARQQKDAEIHEFYDGMLRSCLVILVFMAISEQMVFIIMLYCTLSAIDEIMAISE